MNKILLGLVLGLGFYEVSYAEPQETVATEEAVETAVMPEIGIQANMNQDETSITLEIRLPIFDVSNMEVTVVGDDQSPTKFLIGYEKPQENGEEVTRSVAEEAVYDEDIALTEEVVTEETKSADEREAEKPEGFILVLPDDIDPESMRVECDGDVLRVTFDLELPEQDDEIKEIIPSEEEIEVVVEEEDDEEAEEE